MILYNRKCALAEILTEKYFLRQRNTQERRCPLSDDVARTEEGREKDPGDVGGPEEEGGATEGLLRENQS